MVIKLIFCVVVGLHLVVHGLLQDLSAQPYSKRNIAENDFQGDPHQRCLTLGGLPGYCQYTSSCPAVLTSTSSPTCGSTAHHLAKKVCCPVFVADNTAIQFPDEELYEITDRRANKTRRVLIDNDVRQFIVSPQHSQRPSRLVLPRRCGRISDVNRLRIAGGVEAPRGAWPWLARLGYYDGRSINYLCGGVLISNQHIITAAHCVHNRRDLIFVRLGEHGTSIYGPQDYYIERVIVHNRFISGSRTLRNDIAIIRVADYIPFTNDVQPICLPVEHRLKTLNLTDMLLFVAGWGSPSYYEPPTNELMEVQLPVVEPAKCAEAYKAFDQLRIDDSVLCAGLESGGKDACRGDSGGPLMMLDRHRYFVIGVVSLGVRCAQPGFPGVYSRITHHLEWIIKNIS